MQYIQLQSQAASATPTPGEDKFNFFIDDADGQPKIKDDNGTIITVNGATQTLTSLTYDALIELIMNNELTTGYFYEINDYETCYDQPDFTATGSAVTTGNYKTSGEIQPIIVFATASDQISTDAFQAAYPKDKIKYDWTFGTTEVTGNPAKGRIIERIDEFNNRTDYDHRNILFKRYDMYYPTQELPGTLTMADGVVTGIDTLFTNLSTGDRIYIDNSDLEYMITEIVDDTNMTVTGITYNNVNDSNFSRTNSITGYKRNNTTDSLEFTEYYTFDLDNGEGNEYINNYIGNYVNLKNWDDGIFYLANNVFIGGDYVNNTIGDNSYNNTFDDDCDGNTIGVGFYNNTTDDDFDDNLIGSNFYNNIITSNFNHNQIGNDFNNNIIICDEDFDDNQIGNDFNNNLISCDDFYRNQIGNDFNGNTIIGSDDFQNNVIGNQFNDNIITQEFVKNNIANGYNQNEILVVFTGNVVGNGFNGNNLMNGEFYDNNIGQYFEDNSISVNFNGNSISHNFYSNDIISEEITINFSNNKILNSFENNIIFVEFNNNQIGFEFKGNLIGYDENDSGHFNSNTIGNSTISNMIAGYFENNKVGDGFFINNVYGRFYNNQIGNNFYSNETLDEFSYNRIGNDCYDNNISEYFGYGYGSARGNTIGHNFQSNTIRDHFYDNNICDNFTGNTTPINFQYNDIKYPVTNTNFTINNRTIQTISFTTPTSTQDGSYGSLTGISSIDGDGAYFQVDVVSGIVNSVTIQTVSPSELHGYDYSINETITITANQFNGTEDLVITVTSISDTAMVAGDYNCTIVKEISGSLLLTIMTPGGLYYTPNIADIFSV